MRYRVSTLCGLFGVTKQAYYKLDDNISHRKVVQEEFVLRYVRDIRTRDRGIGGNKLWHMYSRDFGDNFPVGRDRFYDILSKYGLKLRRKQRTTRTTNSQHGYRLYPNLVRDFIPTAANQLWVSDISYIVIHPEDCQAKFAYLSLVLDAYSEEIVGWSLGPTLETCYPIEALRMALPRKGASTKLIHHSDRGCQYASGEYVSLLKEYGIDISMTESGDPKENAQAERINNTMKNELLKDCRFESEEEARMTIAEVIAFYNNERPHMSINMMTPAEAAKCTGEIKKRWHSYRVEAIKREAICDIPQNGLLLPHSAGSPSGLRPSVNPAQG